MVNTPIPQEPWPANQLPLLFRRYELIEEEWNNITLIAIQQNLLFDSQRLDQIYRLVYSSYMGYFMLIGAKWLPLSLFGGWGGVK